MIIYKYIQLQCYIHTHAQNFTSYLHRVGGRLSQPDPLDFICSVPFAWVKISTEAMLRFSLRDRHFQATTRTKGSSTKWATTTCRSLQSSCTFVDSCFGWEAVKPQVISRFSSQPVWWSKFREVQRSSLIDRPMFFPLDSFSLSY